MASLTPLGPIKVDENRIQKRSEITPAVRMFASRLSAICPHMSENFSFPVGWTSANRIHSFPNKGPWNKNPIIKIGGQLLLKRELHENLSWRKKPKVDWGTVPPKNFKTCYCFFLAWLKRQRNSSAPNGVPLLTDL